MIVVRFGFILGVLILLLDAIVFGIAVAYIVITNKELPHFVTVLAVTLLIGMACILCDIP